MENKEIAVQTRSEFGNNASRRARKNGMIPAIIYAPGMEARPVFINGGDFASIARNLPEVLTLVDGDKKFNAKVMEVQIDHLKDNYLHVDFKLVDAAK